MPEKPVILITMGDPAGIGPEICIRAFADPRVTECAVPVLIGSMAVAETYADLLGDQRLVPVARPQDAKSVLETPGTLPVLDTGRITPADFVVGRVSAAAGRASEEYIMKSIDLCMEGQADAVATAPINKAALVASGSRYIDHTQMYSEVTRSPAVTMFEVHALRIFFLTRHVSLRESIQMLTPELVKQGIRSSHTNMRRLGFDRPRLAVAALNPHASDGGLFGDEEALVLVPGIAEARDEGIDVWGPVPADSVFAEALHGRYDAVLSLYHDQGHIAAKTYDFERTVSVTLGLPFIRTSVDHGTAYNIAGKRIARATSLVEAILSAARYARAWRASGGPVR